MEGFLVTAMALTLLALAVLILAGGRGLRPSAAAAPAPPAGSWPPVALLVPVTGAAEGLEGRLRALLRQDYPDYQVVFSTRDARDPATAVILALSRRYSRVRHVVSGPARGCGQKNLNLLAALKLVGQTPEILVFCDSNQEAHPDWLRELVGPVVRGEVEVASGYHQVITADSGIASLGRAVSVLTLYLTKGFRRLNQPWGGATAIRRGLFENLGVGALWAENVVDDVSLAARLAWAGRPVGLSPGACLYTHLEGDTLSGWRDWLTRQWLYLKFCRPATWLTGGLYMHLLLLLVLVAGVRLLVAPLGWTSGGQVLAAALFLTGLIALGVYLRSLHPQPGPVGRWLAAYFAAIPMASYCHLRTLLTGEMSWRGITYRVGWRGKVGEVVSSEQ